MLRCCSAPRARRPPLSALFCLFSPFLNLFPIIRTIGVQKKELPVLWGGRGCSDSFLAPLTVPCVPGGDIKRETGRVKKALLMEMRAARGVTPRVIGTTRRSSMGRFNATGITAGSKAALRLEAVTI